MIRSSTIAVGLSLLFWGHSAPAVDLPNFDMASREAPFAGGMPARAVPAGTITSVDPQRGSPNFVWASRQYNASVQVGGSLEATARAYLEHHAPLYGLSDAALDTVTLERIHDTGRGGIVAVFRQRIDGIEVIHNRLNLLMNRELELVALSGSLHPGAVASDARQSRSFAWSEQDALAVALEDLYGQRVGPEDFVATGERKGGYGYFGFTADSAAALAGRVLTAPARAKRVYYPLSDRVIPAYYLELIVGHQERLDSDAYAYVVDANSGKLLSRRNLTDKAAFNYRVWADEGGDHRPYSGPHEDYAPHPTGMPDGSVPDFVDPLLISMEGFNTGPSGAPDPWLTDDATETRGNNVDAYANHYPPEGYSNGDIRATTTSSQAFDRVYDTSLEPLDSPEQSMAAVAQIFYTVNWLHDYFYDSGFNEEAGNAQRINFGRGGEDGDPIWAQAQDEALAGTRNNATMSTPADGQPPRMSMFLWTGPIDTWAQVVGQSEPLETGTAAFGASNFDLTAPLLVADDGVEPSTDACQAIVNDLSGQIALIDRGECTFQSKSYQAEMAGAAGVIIANNTPEEGPIGMASGEDDPDVSIPALSVSYEDGVMLKDLLAAGAVEIRIYRQSDVERDGTIDNMVVAHEWAHYLHHRLVDCGNSACQTQSEGFGDFNALFLQYREGDAFDGTYSDTQYISVAGSDVYFGIRRLPYSTDFTKNAFTFRHISDGEALPELEYSQYFGNENSESHNSGEVWATMLWEAYMSMLSRTAGTAPDYSFEEGRRRMADYWVTGMIMAPSQPNFTVQRDAILAAAVANDLTDTLLLAEGFARRGIGSCAIDPPDGSSDFLGLEESFVVAPAVFIKDVSLEDDVVSCDEDGILDGSETGTLVVQLYNGSFTDLVDTTVAITSNAPGLQFSDGRTALLSLLEPFETAYVTFEVSLDGASSEIQSIDLNVSVSNAAACEPEIAQFQYIRANYDDVAEASDIDTVESRIEAWTEDVMVGDSLWSRVQEEGIDNHLYQGVDAASVSDVALVSPALEVGDSGSNLTISFDHRYQFEASPLEEGGDDVAWDGGVIEISTDGGSSWSDVSAYADPGYSGVIYSDASNPLGGREAFSGLNPSWPDMDTVTLTLGNAFATQSILFRFRIGTDEAVGDVGWEVDNFEATVIDNTPFPTITPDSPETTVFYPDEDGDGYGNPEGETVTASCPAPDGYVGNAEDCDDTNPETYPGAPEDGVDGLDHNCDGTVEEPPGCGEKVRGPVGTLPAGIPLASFFLAGLWIAVRRRRMP